MKKEITREEREQFFDMAKKGSKGILRILKMMPEYKDIKDERGVGIFNFLVGNNHHELIEDILNRGLSSYSMFREVAIDMASPLCRNDSSYKTFKLLKEEDKQLVAENGWYYLLEYDNVKMLSEINMKNLIKKIKNNNTDNTTVSFNTFVKCSNEALEIAMPIYTELSGNKKFLKGTFKACIGNVNRAIKLIENTKGGLTPELEDVILSVNKEITTYLKNRELNEKLTSELESKNDTQIIKGKKI